MMSSAPSAQEEPLQPGTMQFRKQLAAAVRSISWTYAIFWSISTTRPVLTWNDGFYNGEIKTRKIGSSTMELTADQLVLQRREQLRELYISLLSSECDHQIRRRPVTALSPEDVGDAEWYYVVCMTYAFRPGQCLPGKSFASNGCAWLCNAQSADSKAFPRKLLAKIASIQTIVCVPFMNGVLEVGTTDSVSEEPHVVNRVTTTFWELQFPAAQDDQLGDAAVDGNHGQQQAATMEIDDMIDSLWDGLDVAVVRSVEEKYSSSCLFDHVGASRASCFVAWERTGLDKEAADVAGGGESPSPSAQRLLRKAVGGGAWINNNGRGGSSVKNHVVSERRRREKLNEMFLILKSLVPSINKVDKASILAETIAYLKELEKRVQELESELPSRGRQEREIAGKELFGAKRKPCTEVAGGGGGAEREHRHWVLSQEGTPSDVHVIVMDKDELHLEVRCRWKELMMTRVFDAIKSLRLDVLSVQASAPDGLLGLKIRAKVVSLTP